ncbi:hypothetical protein BDM02DRAFT_1059096 [Thelephora ganbajun]|uniref:Uncharacterized protein n=1 Tax=Thelephora ganbajun TaxID=370292 RepID=A0ACB6Z3Q8_THEGA|nr:hypothetical protein BDM02DRAFT_1059096 [Thelephora ganbajun]
MKSSAQCDSDIGLVGITAGSIAWFLVCGVPGRAGREERKATKVEISRWRLRGSGAAKPSGKWTAMFGGGNLVVLIAPSVRVRVRKPLNDLGENQPFSGVPELTGITQGTALGSTQKHQEQLLLLGERMTSFSHDNSFEE